MGEPTLADLEERVLDDPENPDVHLDMAEGLLAAGEDCPGRGGAGARPRRI